MDVGKVLKNSWDLFVKDIGPLIVAALIPFAITLVAIVPAYVLFFIPLVVSSNDGNDTVSAAAAASGAVVVACLAIVAALLVVPFYGSIVRMILRRTREGRPARYGDVWAGWSQWGSLIGAAVLVGLAVAVGFVLLIIPGIFLAVVFSFVLPVIVDRRVGAVEAMRLSWRLVMGAGFWMVLLNLFVVVVIAGFASQVPLAGILVVPWELAAVTGMYVIASGDERLLPSSFPGPSGSWQGGEPPRYPAYGGPVPGAPGGFVPYAPPPGAPYGDPQPYAASYGPPVPPPWPTYAPAPGQAQPPWQPPGQAEPAAPPQGQPAPPVQPAQGPPSAAGPGAPPQQGAPEAPPAATPGPSAPDQPQPPAPPGPPPP